MGSPVILCITEKSNSPILKFWSSSGEVNSDLKVHTLLNIVLVFKVLLTFALFYCYRMEKNCRGIWNMSCSKHLYLKKSCSSPFPCFSILKSSLCGGGKPAYGPLYLIHKVIGDWSVPCKGIRMKTFVFCVRLIYIQPPLLEEVTEDWTGMDPLILTAQQNLITKVKNNSVRTRKHQL